MERSAGGEEVFAGSLSRVCGLPLTSRSGRFGADKLSSQAIGTEGNSMR